MSLTVQLCFREPSGVAEIYLFLEVTICYMAMCWF